MKKLIKFLKSIIFTGFLFFTSCSSVAKTDCKFAGSTNAKNKDDSFCVKMIDLGANGDCTLITYKDIQILIDCGGTAKSWNTIKTELETVFPSDSDDKVLDYVIFSHGDSDHIVNFGNSDYDTKLGQFDVDGKTNCLASWLFTKKIRIETFIDFDPSADSTLQDFANKDKLFQKVSDESGENSASDLKAYKRYCNARNFLRKTKITNEESYITNYYTGSQCLMEFRDDLTNDEKKEIKTMREKEGLPPLQSTFQFSSSPEGEIHILDNYFSYHEFTENEPTSIDRNIISTCVLIEFDGYKYLFTGDLPEFRTTDKGRASSPRKLLYKVGSITEEQRSDLKDGKTGEIYSFGGESLLVKRNADLLKNDVIYFKAGHHGSFTSNSENLLNIIRPQYIGISCCAAGQYNFPKDTVLTQMCQYTDKIYITSYKKESDDEDASKYHGTTGFIYKSNNPLDELLTVELENTVRKKSLLLEKEIWNLCDDTKVDKDGKNYRRFPIRVIELSSAKLDGIPNDCTYIKIGSLDILINAGVNNANQIADEDICKKIETLCNDHVLDYLIVTSQDPSYYSSLSTLFHRINTKATGAIEQINNFIISPYIGMDLANDNSIRDTLVKSLPKKGNKINTKIIKSFSGIKEDGSFPSLISDIQDKKYIPFGVFNVFCYGENLGTISILKNNQYSEKQEFTFINSLAVNIDLLDSTLNYLNLGSCYDSDANISVLNQIRNPLTTFTIPHFGYIPVPQELDYVRVLKNKMASNEFIALLNAPWGCLNVDGLPIYPDSLWLRTWLFNSMNSDAFVRTNRFVIKDTNKLDTKKSYIDIEQVLNYPVGNKENSQFRKSFSDSTIFSFYGINKNIYNDYNNYFMNSAIEDNYLSYLK